MGNTNDAELHLPVCSRPKMLRPRKTMHTLLPEGNVYRQRGDTYHASRHLRKQTRLIQKIQRPAMPSSSYRRRRGGKFDRMSRWIGVHVAPIFEDENIYQLDARLRGFQNGGALLPPPRHSIGNICRCTLSPAHRHLPTISGFVGERNANGTISIPSQLLIQKRNTLDTIFNFGVTPVLRLAISGST